MKKMACLITALALGSACATPLRKTDSISSAEKELQTVDADQVSVPREFLEKIIDNDRYLQQQNRDLKAQLEAIRAVDLGQAPVTPPAKTSKKKRKS